MTVTLEKKIGIEDRIILVPDPRLRTYWPETDLATSTKTLATMLEWSQTGAKDGRSLGGLSSVQVELPGRVVTAAPIFGGDWVGFINPIVIERAWIQEPGYEGCFSLEKNKFWQVYRPQWAKIQHTLPDGSVKEITLSGSQARFALHEIDHINGILISDFGGKTYKRGE